MRPDKAASHAAAHTAVMGRFQNKHKEARFKAYQATPRKLKASADRLAYAGPQKIHPVTALYLWSTIAPHVRAARSKAIGVAGSRVATHDSEFAGTPRQNSQASAPESIPAGLTRHVRSPHLRRSDLQPLPRKVIPVRTDDKAMEIVRENAASNRGTDMPTQLPSTARTTMLESKSEEAEELRTLSHEANQQVAALLRRQLLAPANDDTDWLASLIENAVNFAAQDASSHAKLARYLQKASGRYGAYVGEVLSLPVQKKIIRNWIVFNLIGLPIEELIENKIQENATEIQFRSIDLHHYLLQATFSHWNLSQKLKTWIFRHVLVEEVPIMAYLENKSDLADADREQLANLKLSAFEWGQIHAGLRLLHSTELASHIDLAEAGQLGKILLAQLQESAAPAIWWAFFRLPARLRYAQVYPELMRNAAGVSDSEIEIQAMVAYFVDHEIQISRQFPLARLNQLLQQFQSRSALAQQIMHEQCPGTRLTDYFGNAQHFCARESKKVVLLPDWRSTKPVLEKVASLPNIDQKFQEQVDAIADPFQVIDRALLTAAYNTMPTDDLDFLNQAEVKWTQVTQLLNVSYEKRTRRDANQASPGDLVRHPRDQVEFFSARNPGDSERIYALEKKNSGYALERVDAMREKYAPYFSEPIEDADYVLKITGQEPFLKNAAQDMHSLLENMSEKHRQDFARHLHDYGSQSSNWESTKDLLLSFIPFYNCITSVSAGETGAALFSCGMDTISLLPLIGKLTSLSVKLGEILGTGGLMAMRNAAIEVNLGNVLRASLKPGENEFVRYAALPAAEVINRHTAATLGMATLRALDPGIELIASLGTIPIRQTIRLGKVMAPSLPRLENILGEIETKLPPPHVPASRIGYILARRRGIYREIPVTLLEGDRYRDRPVYVQINPLSGQPFGRKYVLLQDNVLDPVPLETARHLQNILVQGLGGKGALEQARNWAVNIGELDAAMLLRLQQDLTTGADLTTLARQYELNPHWLRPYLSAAGKLTARGEEMVKCAESRTAHGARATEHMLSPVQPETIASGSASAVAPLPAATAVDATTRRITADAEIRKNFMAHDGMITSHDGIAYLYDLDLDVFFERKFGASEFAYLPDSENEGLAPLSMASARDRASTISNDRRSAVLKALDIDLDITAILDRAPAHLPLKQAIPKRISYVWIGNRAFNDELIAILKENCVRANASGFKVYFYLSEQSRELNYANIKTALCSEYNCLPSLFEKNEIKVLETTNFYKGFSNSKVFQQYRDAIDGNGGIATNFASAADILRLAILKDKGGIYMDIDDVLDESFGKIKLKVDTNGFALSDLLESQMLDMHPEFGTSFFGTHPGNTVIDDILEEIERRYQLPEYRNFYKIARPHRSDRGAMLTYVRDLSALTGPKVFNRVLLEKFPNVKEFVQMSKLEVLCNRPLASKLRQALIEKTPTPQDITPLAGSSRTGNLHSWQEHRRKRAWTANPSSLNVDATALGS